MAKRYQENYLKNLGIATAWAGLAAAIPKDKGTIITPHPLFRLLATLTGTDAEDLQFAYNLRNGMVEQMLIGSENSPGRVLAEGMKS